MAIVLGIESSCDETAAAICWDGKILSNQIAAQKVHQQYGGVVPELASRAHLQNIIPVVDIALQESGVALQDIDAVAFTQSPGLIGALLVGTGFAKSLALALNKPLIAVQHMQAHVLANLLNDPAPQFPFLCLTVSGGHTQLVWVQSPLEMQVLGTTIDDAAGEAFDKAAKMLNLPYPGGPLIDKYAKTGDPLKYTFAQPTVPDLNFSFSGLKTSLLYFLQKKVAANKEFVQNELPHICSSLQHSIISILVKKLEAARIQTGCTRACLAGGVSANSALRAAFKQWGLEKAVQTFIPALEYCTDNAAMISLSGYYKYLANEYATLSIQPAARSTW